MSGLAAAIFRHPVKGFTPEPLVRVTLAPGQGLAFDRLYAVENGPSGFNPAAPAFIPKQKFTVLAKLARVAAARTRFDEVTGVFEATAPGLPALRENLETETGREAFAAWLADLLGDAARAPLKVIKAPDAWRFYDQPQGHVSVVNLASVHDLGHRLGVTVDPLRFRANVYVEGWPAWAENEWTGRDLRLGRARAQVFKPIKRCAATHVDPTTAERDLDVTRALFESYGHMFCGVYLQILDGGDFGVGDAVTAPGAGRGPRTASG